MQVIVTGLECSGTKWMTELLSHHPSIRSAIHTSIPENRMPDSRWPDLDGVDRIVWMLRYEPIRLASVARNTYDEDRPLEFLPPSLYDKVFQLYQSFPNRPVLVSYEGLVSPYGKMVFRHTLFELGLSPILYDWDKFNPLDANRKHFTVVEQQPDAIPCTPTIPSAEPAVQTC